MKEIFDIKRFGKLLKSDILTRLPRLYPTIIAILCLMPVILILHYIGFLFSEITMTTGSRFTVYFIELFAVLFAAPFVIYRTANQRKSGVEFIMRPASAIEKTLSMVIVCSVVVPVIMTAGYLIMDYLIYILPGDFFKGTISKAFMLNSSFFKTIFNMLLIQSALIFGNMLFKRAKVALTIVSLIGVTIAGILALAVIVEHSKLDRLFNSNAVVLISAVVGQDVGDMTIKEFSELEKVGIADNGGILPQQKIRFAQAIESIYGDTTTVQTGKADSFTLIKVYDDTQWPDDEDCEFHSRVKAIKFVNNSHEMTVDSSNLRGSGAIAKWFTTTVSVIVYIFFALMYILTYIRIKKITY